jgi:guanine deaminase
LGEVLGKFEVGYEFDGLMVDCRLDDDEGGFDYFRDDSAEILFEKWVNMGDERNIKRVWVQGKEVTIQGK